MANEGCNSQTALYVLNVLLRFVLLISTEWFHLGKVKDNLILQAFISWYVLSFSLLICAHSQRET